MTFVTKLTPTDKETGCPVNSAEAVFQKLKAIVKAAGALGKELDSVIAPFE